MPNDQWLGGSGLVVEDGVVCDAHLAAAGAGMSSRWATWPAGRTRNSRPRSAPSTGRTPLTRHGAWRITSRSPDAPEAYRPSDYVWSDQYDWKVQVAGQRASAVAEWVIGTPAR